MKKEIILIGGFCETIELCQDCGFTIIGIVDVTDKDAKAYHLSYLGDDETFLASSEQYIQFPLVVCPDSPKARHRIAEKYKDAGFSFASVVSPDAKISKTAILGKGVVIHSGCLVSSRVRINDFVRMNHCASIFHESQVQKAVTIAPYATVLGRVELGEQCYIGAHAVVLPERKLAPGTLVGAGAIVTKDVATHTTVVGVPARAMKQQSI